MMQKRNEKRSSKKKDEHTNESKASEKEIRALAKRLDKVMLELKYLAQNDNTYSSISYSGTDFLQVLTNVPQGDTDSTRDGDQITLHSIEFRLGLKISTTTPCFMRVILFQWRPATIPLYASVLIDQHNTSNAPLTTYQHDTRQEYNILFDRLIELDTVAHPAHVVHHLQTKGFSPKIQFTAGSSTVATNMIYMLVVSDVAAAGPLVVLHVKTTYYDG
jgi:hypothetical protein